MNILNVPIGMKENKQKEKSIRFILNVFFLDLYIIHDTVSQKLSIPYQHIIFNLQKYKIKKDKIE